MSKNIPLVESRVSPFSVELFIPETVCKNFNLTSFKITSIGKAVSGANSLFINRYQYTATNEAGVTKTELRYDIFFSGGVLCCVKNPGFNNFKVISIYENDFKSKRHAIDSGLSFNFGKNLAIKIYDGTTYHTFKGGQTVNRLSSSSGNFLEYIDTCLDEKKAIIKSDVEISEQLEELLKRAEEYSKTDYTLEENSALVDGKIIYESIDATETLNGNKNIYKFNCILNDKQKEENNLKNIIKKWKANKTVEITLNDNTSVSASIFSAELKCKNPYINLSFVEQISADAIPSQGFIKVPLDSNVKRTQIKAITQIREQKVPAAFLDDVLGQGKCAPFSTDNPDFAMLEESFENRQYPLNESQRKAIKNAIASEDIYLVMGPPGTGKTTVISEWVKYFTKNKKYKVLIASQNNSAVDNVLSKLKNEPSVDMLRLSGDEQKIDKDVVNYFYINKIDTARAEISQKVANNSLELNKLLAVWNEIEPSFSLLEQICKKYYDTKTQIDQKLKSAAATYKKARGFVARIFQRKNQYDKKYRILTILQKGYDAYYRFEPIREIFFYIGSLLRFLLKSAAKSAERMRISFNNNINEYNANIDSYNLLIEQILNEFYPLLTASSSDFEQNIKSLNISPLLNDPFGVFDIADDQKKAFSNIESFHTLLDSLTLGRQRLDCAIATLPKWSDHINNTQNYAIESILLESANVIGATCVGISSNPVAANLDFDVVIIDEAGQIKIHDCLIPLRLGKKAILLGDHKQLPPVAKLEALDILEEHDIDYKLYTQSLFEYLYKMLPEENKAMLNIQFRMPEVIANILSDEFYNSKYKSHESKRNITSGIKMFNNKPFVIIDTSDDENRYEKNKVNYFEAKICEKIFSKLTSLGTDAEDIAIVTGLNDQVNLINNTIAATHGKEIANRAVHSVDSYQGRECDTVIFSFCRSSDEKSTDAIRVGFLSELRRLNVAMSRCKRCLVLVGDMGFLSECANISGYKDMAKKGLIGTEEKFSSFLNKLLTAAKDSTEALYLSSKDFYERLDD